MPADESPRAQHPVTPALWLAVLLACAAPHVVRWLSPSVAATDGYYAHAAWMIAEDYTPYVQFVHVAFPFAEQVLALVIRAFGHGLAVVEAANLLVVLGAAAALFAAGRRLAGTTAGVVAALAWSWSLWVLHFHLFEPETWAAFGSALALLLCADRRPLAGGRAVQLALVLLLAATTKLTAATTLAGIGLHLLLTGRAREAVRVGLLFLALFLLATLLCWLTWGRPFLVQVFLFGFFRNGERTFWNAFATLMRWTDPALGLGLVALVVHGLPRLRQPIGAAACVLLFDLLYVLVLNPVDRNHNLIALMPAAALLAGSLVAHLRSRRTAVAAALAGAVLVGLVMHTSRIEGGYMPGGYGGRLPGFGGEQRADLERHAEFLRRHSREGDVVLTVQPWWSFVAGRAEAVRYLDLQEVTEGIEASLRADGLRATWAKRQGPLLLGPGLPPTDARIEEAVRTRVLSPYAGRLAANALEYVKPQVLQALARHEVALVVEPMGMISAGHLQQAGYERFEDPELGVTGWRPRGGARQAAVRELFPR